MSFSQVTRAHVLKAIAEYDLLGEEAFLAKYKFGPAKLYSISEGGRLYPSKAIIGVAHGYAVPSQTYTTDDFSGGLVVVAFLEKLGFKITKPSNETSHAGSFKSVLAAPAEPYSNPNWSREETILALEVLVRRKPQLPDQFDSDIVALSTLLRDYADAKNIARNAKYRNPEGVSMKVANLSRLDGEDGRKGLPHGAKTEEAVWKDFAPDFQTLTFAAASIRTQMLEQIGKHLKDALRLYRRVEIEVDLEAADIIIEEARWDGIAGEVIESKKHRYHYSIERRSNAAQEVKKAQGYRCKGCDKEMVETYGEIGKDVIHVHHLTPFSSLEVGIEVKRDPHKDFAVLCPNCHAIIHRLEDVSDVDGLRSLIASMRDVPPARR